MLEHRQDTGTEADWQTVTTERANEPIFLSLGGRTQGTSSSLADISDGSAYDLCQCDRTSTDKILQHPVPDDGTGSYYLRNDKQTNRPVLVPKFNDAGNLGFLQNSSRKTPQKPARAASAIHQFSNSFRRGGSAQKVRGVSKIFEMDTLSHSFESLDSEPPENMVSFSPTGLNNKGDKFSWSRIRHNLGREPPKATLTVFDQPLYRPEILDAGRPRAQTHVPHDVFLNEIPQLPFPLISLPEAAMLQHFRRERGEEDHTEPIGSFVSRQRHGTVSTTASSRGPTTPLVASHDSFDGCARQLFPFPAPVHRFGSPCRRPTSKSLVMKSKYKY